jgi:hypothetical protein
MQHVSLKSKRILFSKKSMQTWKRLILSMLLLDEPRSEKASLGSVSRNELSQDLIDLQCLESNQMCEPVLRFNGLNCFNG